MLPNCKHLIYIGEKQLCKICIGNFAALHLISVVLKQPIVSQSKGNDHVRFCKDTLHTLAAFQPHQV
jgi:hypothetical protein